MPVALHELDKVVIHVLLQGFVSRLFLEVLNQLEVIKGRIASCIIEGDLVVEMELRKGSHQQVSCA